MLVSLITKGHFSATLHAELNLEKETAEFFVVARTLGENGRRQCKETYHTDFAEAAKVFKEARKQIEEGSAND